MTDYMANPTVLKKNYLVLKDFCDVLIPQLEKAPELFEEIQNKIAIHLK